MNLNEKAYNYILEELASKATDILEHFEDLCERSYSTPKFKIEDFALSMDKIILVIDYYQNLNNEKLPKDKLKRLSNELISLYHSDSIHHENNKQILPVLEKYIDFLNKECDLYQFEELIKDFSNQSSQHLPFFLQLVNDLSKKEHRKIEADMQEILNFIYINSPSNESVLFLDANKLLHFFLESNNGEKHLKPQLLYTILNQDLSPNFALYHFLKLQMTVLDKGDEKCLQLLEAKWEKLQIDKTIGQALHVKSPVMKI